MFFLRRDRSEDGSGRARAALPTGEGDAALVRDPHLGARGFSLIEVLLAMVLMTVASLSVVSSMLTGAQVDEDLRERSRALRAALARLERVQSFDDGGDITNLIAYATAPGFATFDVDGLGRPRAAAIGWALGGDVPHGAVTVDASDAARIRFAVRVAWTSRRGFDQTLTLPLTLTEIAP